MRTSPRKLTLPIPPINSSLPLNAFPLLERWKALQKKRCTPLELAQYIWKEVEGKPDSKGNIVGGEPQRPDLAWAARQEIAQRRKNPSQAVRDAVDAEINDPKNPAYKIWKEGRTYQQSASQPLAGFDYVNGNAEELAKRYKDGKWTAGTDISKLYPDDSDVSKFPKHLISLFVRFTRFNAPSECHGSSGSFKEGIETREASRNSLIK
jgi:hypothetical protein